MLPPSKFTNLSVHAKEFSALKRKFQARYGDTPMVNWIMETMNGALDKSDILEKVFPHLKLIQAIPEGIILFDTKQSKPANITTNKGVFTCTLDSGYCEHIAFACLHPQFKIKT